MRIKIIKKIEEKMPRRRRKHTKPKDQKALPVAMTALAVGSIAGIALMTSLTGAFSEAQQEPISPPSISDKEIIVRQMGALAETKLKYDEKTIEDLNEKPLGTITHAGKTYDVSAKARLPQPNFSQNDEFRLCYVYIIEAFDQARQIPKLGVGSEYPVADHHVLMTSDICIKGETNPNASFGKFKREYHELNR